MTKTKIKPEEWYTLKDLVEHNAFPWCNPDVRLYRRFLKADMESQDFLKAVIIGEGRTTRYRIQGKNIINLQAKVKSGAFRF